MLELRGTYMFDVTLPPERYETCCGMSEQPVPSRVSLGIDEAGRGPLAGPVVAAAVALPKQFSHERIRDSKQLAGEEREKLYEIITANALSYGIVSLGPREIEEFNIRNATRIAMTIAAREVYTRLSTRNPRAQFKLLIDGDMPAATNLAQETIIKGDASVFAISAASILAKVWRDRLMTSIEKRYPGYGFAAHKGYPTTLHREKIKKLGPCEIHRRTFAGVREHLSVQRSLLEVSHGAEQQFGEI